MGYSRYFINKCDSLKKERERYEKRLIVLNTKIDLKKTERDEYLKNKRYVSYFMENNKELSSMAKHLQKLEKELRLMYLAKERIEFNIKSIDQEISLLNETIASQLDTEGYTK